MMTRKLGFVFAVVAAAALAGACGGDDTSSKGDGSVTPDSSMQTVDAKVADSGTATDGARVQDGATSCSPTVTPKDATTFCTDYARICTFTGTGHYTSMSDCTTKYTAATTQQQCR